MTDITVNSVSIQNKKNCLQCRIFGSVAFLLVAGYFYIGCKHVKPVYYIGTPSMISLAVTRAFNLPPFNNDK